MRCKIGFKRSIHSALHAAFVVGELKMIGEFDTRPDAALLAQPAVKISKWKQDSGRLQLVLCFRISRACVGMLC